MLRTISLVVASTMLATATCERAPTPTPDPAPPPSRPIYSMACVSEDVHYVAGRLGFQRYRNITKSYFQNGRNTPRPHPDLEKFERVLKRGLRKRPECIGEVRSVEAEYNGVLGLDIEGPFWNPFRHSEDYTDEDRDWAAGVFNTVSAALKRLRPQATIILHQSMFGPDTERWWADINTHVDGSSPSMYMKLGDKTPEAALEGNWIIHSRRLRQFLHYKAEHPGFLIYPTIWAMWRDNRATQIPLDVAREQVRRILAFEHEGQKVDGLFIFSLTRQADGTENPRYDIAYLAMLAEKIARKSGG